MPGTQRGRNTPGEGWFLLALSARKPLQGKHQLNQLENRCKVYRCYEAAACGSWFQRELVQRGAVNFVVAPRPLGPSTFENVVIFATPASGLFSSRRGRRLLP